MKRTIPHNRRPRYQEIKHRGNCRFVRVCQIPATWVQCDDNVSDIQAKILFEQHQARTSELIKYLPKNKNLPTLSDLGF
jgi:2-hydroxy-3-keto-5-methylthiopentenyl-1-phosphate phosphatase